MAPLLELLMDNPIRGEGGSFGDCRLEAWQMAELNQDCLQRSIVYMSKNEPLILS